MKLREKRELRQANQILRKSSACLVSLEETVIAAQRNRNGLRGGGRVHPRAGDTVPRASGPAVALGWGTSHGESTVSYNPSESSLRARKPTDRSGTPRLARPLVLTVIDDALQQKLSRIEISG